MSFMIARSRRGRTVSPAPQIPGLYAAYEADRNGSGAGSRVGVIRDRSGNNRHLVQASGTATYVPDALNGRGVIRVGPSTVNRAVNFFTSTTAVTGTVVGVWRMNGTCEPMWDSTSSWWWNLGAAAPQAYYFNKASTRTVVNRNALTPNDHHYFHGFWENTPTVYGQGTHQATINYQDVGCANGINTSSAAGRSLEVPRSGTMEFAELRFYGRRLAWSELFRLNRYFSRRYGTPGIDDMPGAVLFLGNSTTQSVPSYASSSLATTGAAIFNLGYSGGSIATMENQQGEILEIAGDFRARGKKAVVYVHHGHNNGFGSTSSESTNTIVRHLKGEDGSTLFASIRALGAKILLVTPTPWHGSSGTRVNNEAARQTLRNWMLASAVGGGYADAVYDLGNTAELGVFGNVDTATGANSWGNYPTLWSDAVHQTAAGEQVKADYIDGPIADLFAVA